MRRAFVVFLLALASCATAQQLPSPAGDKTTMIGGGGAIPARATRLPASASQGAMVIDPRKSNIFKRLRSENGRQFGRSVGRENLAARHAFEQVLKFGRGHVMVAPTQGSCGQLKYNCRIISFSKGPRLG